MKQSHHVDSKYAYFVALSLNLAYVLSYLDRQILTLLIDPIRADFRISDTAMSLLTGFAFVAIHSVMLVPVGHLADQFSRKKIIAVGIAAWSAFTVACGLSGSYTALLLARMGVGLGEAALIPAAYSMLADYFSRGRLQRAVSIFVIGAPLGAALALIIGGSLIDFLSQHPLPAAPFVGAVKPWQSVFILVGMMGMPVLLLLLFVKEPPRKDMMAHEGVVAQSLPASAVLKFLGERRVLLLLMTCGLALVNITAYGALTWLPTFFIRTHGWTAADAGIMIGMIALVFGVAGPGCSLWLFNLFEKRGRVDATILVSLSGALVILPSAISAPLVANQWLALALTAPIFLGVYIVAGTIPTLIQTITPNQLRARISGGFIMILNLVGLGLGPTIVALCTDYLFKNDSDLRYAMAFVFSVSMVLGCVLLFFSLRPFGRAAVMARQWENITIA